MEAAQSKLYWNFFHKTNILKMTYVNHTLQIVSIYKVQYSAGQDFASTMLLLLALLRAVTKGEWPLETSSNYVVK